MDHLAAVEQQTLPSGVQDQQQVMHRAQLGYQRPILGIIPTA
jgi:hypothetical protein